METNLDQNELKILIKAALSEVLREERELLSDAMEDALEEIALARAITEGNETEQIDREEVFGILRDAK